MKKFIINDSLYSYRLQKTDTGYQIVVLDAHNAPMQTLAVTHVSYDKTTSTLFFQVGDQPYKAHVALDDKAGGWQVSVAGTLSPSSVQHPTPEHSPGSFGQAPTVTPKSKQPDTHVLKSPLAGRVNKVLVAPCQTVRSGQPLVLIESMKMENEICAPRAAIIKTIFIAEGNVVQPDQILVEFEKEEGDGDATTQSSHGPKAI